MTIIRTDTMLYWTGSEWSRSPDDAKLYPSDGQQAAAEIRELILIPPPHGDTLLIVAVTSAN
jgi:hypothetical protein